MMTYQQLGSSDLHISRIGFGCMSLKQETPGPATILHKAIDRGINFFDTADLYEKGWNEEMVGAALKEHRNKVIIATKVGNQWRADGSGWDWNPRKEYILQAADKSLQRLQTNHIDLYQLHGGTIEDNIDEAIEAFELLQQQGKIRYYGISSIRPNVIRRWIEKAKPVSVMMQYSLLDRRPEETILPLLMNKQTGVLVRGALAQGALAGKQASSYLGYSESQVQSASDAVQSISGDKRKPSQTALQFALMNPAVTSVVAGMRTMEQLNEVADTTTVEILSEAERIKLSSLLEPNIYTDHR